jgi:hypothetical protein
MIVADIRSSVPYLGLFVRTSIHTSGNYHFPGLNKATGGRNRRRARRGVKAERSGRRRRAGIFQYLDATTKIHENVKKPTILNLYQALLGTGTSD